MLLCCKHIKLMQEGSITSHSWTVEVVKQKTPINSLMSIEWQRQSAPRNFCRDICGLLFIIYPVSWYPEWNVRQLQAKPYFIGFRELMPWGLSIPGFFGGPIAPCLLRTIVRIQKIANIMFDSSFGILKCGVIIDLPGAHSRLKNELHVLLQVVQGPTLLVTCIRIVLPITPFNHAGLTVIILLSDEQYPQFHYIFSFFGNGIFDIANTVSC